METMTKNRTVDPLLIQMFTGAIRKSDLRKAKIIEGAIAELAERGFENLSFESIGARTKTRKSHVNYYFKSKEDILRRCFEYMAGTAQNLVVERISSSVGAARLKAYIEANFEWIRLYPDQATLFMLFYSRAAYLEEYSNLNKTFRTASLLRIEALLADIGLMDNSSAIQRRSTAQTLLDLITGAVVEIVTTPRKNLKATTQDKSKLIYDMIVKLIKAGTQKR